MQITLNYSELYGVVERSLSIIAKRSIDEKGNRLFADITLGSREVEIVSDYIRSAIVHIAADLRQYVTLETPGSGIYTLGITLYADANTKLEDTIRQAVKDYIVAYTLYSWFNVSAPRIYEKYLSDANAMKNFIIAQVFHRQRPSTMPNPLSKKVDPKDK